MLKLKVNNNQEAQDKHDAYLKAGFKLKSTKQNKYTLTRTYQEK